MPKRLFFALLGIVCCVLACFAFFTFLDSDEVPSVAAGLEKADDADSQREAAQSVDAAPASKPSETSESAKAPTRITKSKPKQEALPENAEAFDVKILGVIVDRAGTPISGASIKAAKYEEKREFFFVRHGESSIREVKTDVSWPKRQTSKTVVSNASGEFEIRVKGYRATKESKHSILYRNALLDVWADGFPSAQIKVRTDTRSARRVKLILLRGVRIYGKVLTREGDPVANAQVRAGRYVYTSHKTLKLPRFSKFGYAGVTRCQFTDEEGRFDFPNLAPGKWTVSAQNYGMSKNYISSNSPFPKETLVALEDHKLELILDPLGELRFNITNPDVNEVSLHMRGSYEKYQLVRGEDGHFSSRTLHTSVTGVHIKAEGYRVIVKQFGVSAGENKTLGDLTLEPLAFNSFKFEDEAGNPIGGVEIADEDTKALKMTYKDSIPPSTWPTFGGIHQRRLHGVSKHSYKSDAKGIYRFQLWRFGSYKYFFMKEGFQPLKQEIWFRNEEKTHRIVMRRPSTLRVMVEDPSGRLNGKKGKLYFGSFYFTFWNSLPRSHTIEALATGVKIGESQTFEGIDPEWEYAYFRMGNVISQATEIKKSGEARDVKIQIPAQSSLRGIVRDQEGNPMAGIRIYLENGKTRDLSDRDKPFALSYETTSDAQGRYLIEHLPLGFWRIRTDQDFMHSTHDVVSNRRIEGKEVKDHEINIDFKILGGTKVFGSITNNGKAFYVSAQLSQTRRGRGKYVKPRTLSVSEDGSFEWRGLNPGHYQAVFKTKSYSGPRYYHDFEIEEGAEELEIRIESKSKTLTGTIKGWHALAEGEYLSAKVRDRWGHSRFVIARKKRLTISDLPYGTHSLTLSGEGYSSVHLVLEVSASSSRSFEIDMPARSGRVRLVFDGFEGDEALVKAALQAKDPQTRVSTKYESPPPGFSTKYYDISSKVVREIDPEQVALRGPDEFRDPLTFAKKGDSAIFEGLHPINQTLKISMSGFASSLVFCHPLSDDTITLHFTIKLLGELVLDIEVPEETKAAEKVRFFLRVKVQGKRLEDSYSTSKFEKLENGKWRVKIPVESAEAMGFKLICTKTQILEFEASGVVGQSTSKSVTMLPR